MRSKRTDKAETKFKLADFKREKKFLVVDETGDKKKGKTDYISWQYLGKLGKIDTGIVAVPAWRLINDIILL